MQESLHTNPGGWPPRALSVARSLACRPLPPPNAGIPTYGSGRLLLCAHQTDGKAWDADKVLQEDRAAESPPNLATGTIRLCLTLGTRATLFLPRLTQVLNYTPRSLSQTQRSGAIQEAPNERSERRRATPTLRF